MRHMINATAANVPRIYNVVKTGDIVGYYCTGTPDIRWDSTQRSMFPGHVMVAVDQDGEYSPVFTAPVRDVEDNAWSAAKATITAGWIAARPTIYCDMNDLESVLNYGWKGDLWLAIPGPAPLTPPRISGCTVVAVQYDFLDTYESSVVFDDYWPSNPPEEKEMLNATCDHDNTVFLPFAAGQFTTVMLYRDFVSTTRTATVRLNMHSASGAVHYENITINHPSPVSVTAPFKDMDAISVEYLGGVPGVGVTVH